MTKRITDAIVGRPAVQPFPETDPATMESTSTVEEKPKPKRKSRAKAKKTGFSGRTMGDGLRYVDTNGTLTRIDDKKCETPCLRVANKGKIRRSRKNFAKVATRAAIRAQFGEKS